MEKTPQTGMVTKAGDSLDKLVGGMNGEVFRSAFSAFMNELGEIKLDLEKVKTLAREKGVRENTIDSWHTAADLMRHFDSAELVKKYPQEAKTIMTTVMMVIPYANIVGMLSMALPDETVSKVQETLHKATPEHLANVLINKRIKTLEARSAEYALPDPEEEGKRNMAVVTQDDLLYEMLVKLTETADDGEDGIVGTRDGSVRLMHWDEKKYEFRTKDGGAGCPVLIVGRKASDMGVRLMDVLFDRYGVRCGVLGSTAYITADLRRIRAKGVYDEFLKELRAMPLPESLTADKKLRLTWKTGLKAALATPLIAKDIYSDSAEVKRQMYFYGVTRFYYEYMEDFLKED